MNRHYDRYLVRKYAPLYQDRHADMRTTAMCWGFEVGDGWFNIINNLSRLLCNDWLLAQQHYQLVAGRVGQLRYPDGEETKWNSVITQEEVDQAQADMTAAAARVPRATQVKEKYGTLRFYVDGASEEQWAYITFAEAMSAVTCEVCGDRGRRNQSGWVVTRCRKHEDD